jgi:glycine cleavage system transcriptional repressor
MNALAVTAIGADRPGIVAAVTGVLLDEGCNLQDTAMSILRGQFAMVLVVAAPDGVDAARLERAIGERTAGFDLLLAVRTLHDTHESAAPIETWTAVVHGADQPGIVHAVAAALATLDVNILDLTTRVAESTPPIYSMLVELALPPGVDPAAVTAALDRVAADLDVTCTLHPSDADLL